MTTLEIQTSEQWWEWLARHHDSQSEVWLVFYKRETGRPSIAYANALDEALCFGWVDSLIKRLDGERYARKFTPRKPDSRWSTANRKRFAELQAAGRLTPAGWNRPPTERGGDAPRPSLDRIPAYITKGLRSQPAAWKNFQALAPSHRRRYLGWIDSAKQQETKQRRLRDAVRLLAAGQKLGLK